MRDEEMKRAGIKGLCLAAAVLTLAACVGPYYVDPRKSVNVPVGVVPVAAASASTTSATKVPAGYRRVMKNGVETFCSKEPVTGSRMESFERCFSKAQMESFRQNAELFMRRQQSAPIDQPAIGNTSPYNSVMSPR
jgi:hypothetical protein